MQAERSVDPAVLLEGAGTINLRVDAEILRALGNGVEDAIAKDGFLSDGPMADRHGCPEQQYQRDRGDGSVDVLTLAFTWVEEHVIDAILTPGVVRGNDYLVGEARAERLHLDSSKDARRLVAAASELSRHSTLWRRLGRKTGTNVARLRSA